MELTIEEVFEAYYECRRTKRYSSGALSFESNLEDNLLKLYQELVSRSWSPGRSSCFIVTYPVRREIFAAPFRDRIVHHILIHRLEKSFERYFIRTSFACRKGKGTHAAIARVAHAMRSETDNGKTKAYVLKLDIKGFFMSIDRKLLYDMLCRFIDTRYRPTVPDGDVELEKYLAEKIIFTSCTENCIRKSPESEWYPLPPNKSLFTAQDGCGLPIGNLTSQNFANFYLTPFDHYMKHTLGIKHYIRYVDDCVIVHRNRLFLKLLVPMVRRYLSKNLELTLHPRKLYLQECSHGVQFLGCCIKPTHVVVTRRVRRNFVNSLARYSRLAFDRMPEKEEQDSFLSSTNSYLGILAWYKTWRFRTEQLKRYMAAHWARYFDVRHSARKVERRRGIG